MGDNGTPVTDIVEMAQRDCRRKRDQCRGEVDARLKVVDERLDKKHDQLMVLVGPNGKNGKVGQMRKELDEVKSEQDKTKVLVIKLMLVMASSSAIGAGASHALLKLL